MLADVTEHPFPRCTGRAIFRHVMRDNFRYLGESHISVMSSVGVKGYEELSKNVAVGPCYTFV